MDTQTAFRLTLEFFANHSPASNQLSYSIWKIFSVFQGLAGKLVLL